MTLRFLVGVELRTSPDPVIGYALSLARRAGAAVHLLHVCQPWSANAWFDAYPEGLTALELAKLAEQRFLEQAEEAMQALVATLPDDVPLTTAVVFGTPVETLTEEAKRQRPHLILCGRSTPGTGFLASGFSTAYGLLTTTTQPLLVVPEDTSLPPADSTLLICDDLSPESCHVIQEALALGRLMSTTRYVHLNVCSMNEREIENMSAFLAEAMSAGMIRHDPDFSLYQAMKKATGVVEARLKQRFLAYANSETLASASYHPLCIQGRVTETIRDQQEAWQAHLTVFGRHEFLHHKPLALGKVPLRFLASLEQPILVVPPQPRRLS